MAEHMLVGNSQPERNYVEIRRDRQDRPGNQYFGSAHLAPEPGEQPDGDRGMGQDRWHCE